MALQLLAGPFPVMTRNGKYARFFSRPMWFDNLQAFVACLYVNDTPNYIRNGFLVQIDGKALPRNDQISVYESFFHDLGTSGIATASSYSSGEAKRNVDWISLSTVEASLPSPINLRLGRAMFLSDRIIMPFTNGDMYWRPYSADTWTFEADLPAIPSASAVTVMMPGSGANRTAFVAGANNAVLYDYDDKAVVGWERRLGWNSRWPMVYSPQLGVWFAFDQINTPETHDRVWVYADAPTPTALATPTALSTPNQGKSVQFRTRLTGNLGEPCEGYLIDWSVTAGPGVLLADQSTTDANGYATVTVGLPVGNVGVNTTVQAQVLF